MISKFLFLLIFLVAIICSADEVQMKNGDRITGQIIKSDGKTLILKTAYAEDLTISHDAIQQIISVVVDEIHVTAMIFIFAIALAGIYSQMLFDKDQKIEAERFDKRALWITLICFIAINATLIWSAAIRG